MPYEHLNIPPEQDGWVKAFSSSGPNPSLRLHSHRELEINLVVKGTGSYFIQAGRYSLSPGTLLWLFPDQRHVLFETSPEFRMWIAVFRPRLIRRLAQTPELSLLCSKDPGTVFVQHLPAEKQAFLENLCGHIGGQVPVDEAAYLNAGLGYLLRRAWDEGREANSLPAVAPVHPAVERVLHLMRGGALEGSLVELSKRAGLSYSRLSSLFRKEVGETLSDYRNRLRVERFQQLASSDPRKTVLERALEAGFGSYAQCHRMVRKWTGRAPREMGRRPS